MPPEGDDSLPRPHTGRSRKRGLGASRYASAAKPVGTEDPTPRLTTVDRKARLRIPPHHVTKQTPYERVYNWDEVFHGYTPAPAMFEAQRCIQCPAAPCIKACPVHNDIPAALWKLESGRIAESAAIFRATSNMPELCGRLCPQESLCEGSCVVGKNAKPVAIGKLEAFVADWDRSQRSGFPVRRPTQESSARVAVVGSGPAGLAVAEELRASGHAVTIFDAWPLAGGLLRYGIPNFKTAKSIVDEKIDALLQAGIEFRCNTRVGIDIAWRELATYDAVFIAHGAGLGRRLRQKGEELVNVYIATEFLVRTNLPETALPAGMHGCPRLGDHVVVVGGGDTSMDCVRSAIRLGAGQVTLLYRRTEAEMIGREEERRHAREEGVRFEYLATPVEILGRDGVVTGLECMRMELGEPDDDGRRWPVPIEGSEFVLEADTVVIAVGYDVGQEFLGPESEIDVDDWGRIVTDEEGRTSRGGVFAAGDNVRGADLVVTALADARRTVLAIESHIAAVLARRGRAG